MRADLQLLGQTKPKCQTQENLCFRTISEKERMNPPFPLHLHPHQFYCAQIPGIHLNDIGLFDGINSGNEDIRILFIEILAYVRDYREKLQITRTSILPKTEQEFPALNREYPSKLDALIKALDIYISILENVLKDPKQDDFLKKFADAFTKFAELKLAADTCHTSLMAVEEEARKMSIKYSPEFAEALEGKTIYQVMNSRRSWGSKFAEMAKTFARTMPKDGHNKEIMLLLAFSANISKDLESRAS